MKHIPGVRVKACFDLHNNKKRYRLDLWKDGAEGQVVCAIMQNPSYANEDQSDRSVNYLAERVLEHKSSSLPPGRKLIVVNLYPDLQTRDYEADRDWMVTPPIDGKNYDHIRSAIGESDSVILAWGASSRHRRRQIQVLLMIGSMKKKSLFFLPTHPSRASSDGDAERVPP